MPSPQWLTLVGGTAYPRVQAKAFQVDAQGLFEVHCSWLCAPQGQLVVECIEAGYANFDYGCSFYDHSFSLEMHGRAPDPNCYSVIKTPGITQIWRHFGDSGTMSQLNQGNDAMGTSVAKQERIGARVPRDVYETLNRAAELTGATVNQFLVQSALKEAQAVIEREQTIRLSRRDCARLLELLETPPKPNARFKAAMNRYQKAKRTDADSSFNWKP